MSVVVSSRAKFRCLKISHSLKAHAVELKPVIAKTDSWPGGSIENMQFWHASPVGEAELFYKPDALAEVPFRLGSYYYVDMREKEGPPGPYGSEWVLGSLTEHGSQLDVVLFRHWSHDQDEKDPLTHARLFIGIQNVGAWAAFRGKVGRPFHVTFTEAVGAVHSGCPYTS